MLIRSSLSNSTEAALSLTSDNGEQELIRDWITGGGTLQKSPGCEHTRVGLKRSIQDTDREGNCTHILNYLSSSSQHSTVGTMSETSLITSVYKRRRLRDGSSFDQASIKEKPSRTEISCEVLLASAKEHENSIVEVETETDRALPMLPTECSRGALLLRSTPEGWHSEAEVLGSTENPKCDEIKNVEAFQVNDSCSSSQLKTNLCATTSEPKVGDTGLGNNSNRICSLTCKVCDQSEMTAKMLICDQCKEAYHASCCNPTVKKIPRSQWSCHSCLKKRHKASKETSRASLKKKGGVNKTRNVTSKCASSPIALMLEENEPYTSNVRVGPEFQAEIPDCCGPIYNREMVNIGKPLEIHPSVGVSSQERNSGKNLHISICNWLQCRQVMDYVAGTVCGKWRRAPLFELQTDTWECFDSFLWNPTHADCAVPQEVDTEKVLKDLKYIEKLRPRLAANKQKVGRTKSSDRKRKGPAKGARNVGAS